MKCGDCQADLRSIVVYEDGRAMFLHSAEEGEQLLREAREKGVAAGIYLVTPVVPLVLSKDAA